MTTNLTATPEVLEALGIDPTLIGAQTSRAMDALVSYAVNGVRIELTGPWADILGWFQPALERQLGFSLGKKVIKVSLSNVAGPWKQIDILDQIEDAHMHRKDLPSNEHSKILVSGITTTGGYGRGINYTVEFTRFEN